MTSREEFAAFASGLQQPNGDSSKGWARQQQSSSTSPPKPRPPQAPKMGETAPLLPPMPQSALPPSSVYDQPKQSRPRGHGRSRSDMISFAVPLQPDPGHPFNRPSAAASPPMPAGPAAKRGSGNRPPRAGSMVPPPPPPVPLPGEFTSPLSYGSPAGAVPGPARKKVPHRRAKSDIPHMLFSDASVASKGVITKADLLKSLPSPRWGGAPKPLHTRNRSRAGSDGPLLSDAGSVSSGGYLSGGGYGATSTSSIGGDMERGHPLLQSIGSVELAPDAKRATRHVRAMSTDASVRSVTTDMGKSALFKAVTDTGRIQLQLPKDGFRILMDSSLKTGDVYKRKLVEDEDEFFVDFHTVDEERGSVGCVHCQEKEKRLPPDLYVMAVDSTIYRRMLDEVIASRTMPCGTFFCGHHEDVSHPDITIAVIIVSVTFVLLLAGTTLL